MRYALCELVSVFEVVAFRSAMGAWRALCYDRYGPISVPNPKYNLDPKIMEYAIARHGDIEAGGEA